MAGIPEMIAQGAVNVAGNLVSQEMQAKHYRENEDYTYALSQRAQRSTYQNAVDSLKEAGLNPAMATGASASSVPVAPSTSPSGAVADAPNPEFGMIDSKKDLMRAQEQQIASGIALNYSGYKKNIADANKADEEARGSKLQNDALEEQNEIVNKQAGAYLSFLENEARAAGDVKRADILHEMYQFWNDPARSGASFGSGMVRAIDLLNDAMIKDSDKYTKFMDNTLKNSITQATLKEREVVDAIVKAPLTERLKLYGQMRETAMHVGLLQEQIKSTAANTQNTEAETKLVDANVEKTRAEIVKLGREAAAMLYSDPHQMWDEGEYFHLGAYLVGQTMDKAVDVGTSLGGAYIGGKAFGAGVSKAASAPKPSLILPPSSSNVDRMYREHGAYFEHH